MRAHRNAPRGRWITAVAALALCGLAAAVHGQSRDWTTSGFDAQRTRWVRTDARLTKAAIEDGEFRFLWKATFDNEPRQLHSLTEPVLQDLLIGYRGFKTLAFVGGTADRLFAIDTDLGKPYWTTHVTYAAATGGVPPSSWECPGGLLATPARRTSLTPWTFTRGSGRRGGRATSAVGEPGKGAAVLAGMAAARQRTAPSDPPPPPAQAPTRTVAPVPFGGVDPLYVMGSDGLLRTLRVSDGANMAPPVAFLPPSTYPSSLTFINGLVYTTTSNGCGAAANAVWALDTVAPDHKVLAWDAAANIVGSSGPAIGVDGRLYVALAPSATVPPRGPAGSGVRPAGVPANALVALDGESLAVKDWFAIAGSEFNSAPVVLRHGTRDIVAVTSADGRLFLLDATSLGGADHATPLHVTAPAGATPVSPGLATWEDEGTRWVLAPAGDTIAAHRVVDNGAALTLERAWQTRPLVSPLAPIVVNGIVFVVSSGEFRGGDSTLSASDRVSRSRPAVLYALEGTTGKELWNSGTSMTSFARGGLSAGGGQVYVVTYDGTLYAFGIPMEH